MGVPWWTQTPVMSHLSGLGPLLPQRNCDPVSKEGGSLRQPTISEQMLLFRRKGNISHLKIFIDWIVLIFSVWFLLSCSSFFFKKKICSAMCSVDFYSVPILLELHVLVNFRVRSSQLPSTTKAGWLTAGNTLNVGKPNESRELQI